VAQKFGTIILYALTLPSINQFSKLFHYQNQEKICNNTITKDPTIKICKQISTPPQPYQKIPDIYFLRSCSLPNFITIP